jgi:hypothetical protein
MVAAVADPAESRVNGLTNGVNDLHCTQFLLHQLLIVVNGQTETPEKGEDDESADDAEEPTAAAGTS